jgi:polyhydroxybutyrate depolymerase
MTPLPRQRLTSPHKTACRAAALLSLLLAAPVVAGQPAHAVSAGAATCGADTPCVIDGGQYRIRFPDGWDGRTRLGAIVFLHGWNGSAEAEMKNRAWAALANRLNVAFIAPQGAGNTWSYPGSPSSFRDEFAFFDTLVGDLVTRFPIRRDRLMAAGFSMGASMVWNLACRRGDLFAGYAPVAGAFWDPVPQTCPSQPPILFHVHGTTDRTVPLQGRSIDDQWRQSDVAESLAVWQRQMGVPVIFPERKADSPALVCQRQESPDPKSAAMLDVCLHDGGHSVRAEWIARAWVQLAARLNWKDRPGAD